MRTSSKIASICLTFVLACSAVFATSCGTLSPKDSVPGASKTLASVAGGAALGSEAKATGGPYRDGVFGASAMGKFGKVPVRVTIEGGKIVGIALGPNSEAEPMAQRAQDAVVSQIIELQGVEDIDFVSGATLTSQAIVEAVGKALVNACL